MRLRKRILSAGALLFAGLLIIGSAAQAGAGKSGQACPSSTKSGCAAAQMGLCGGAAKTACGMEKGKATQTQAAVPMKAGSMFPEGTMVTQVEVPGGTDLLFTGSDLAAIEKVLKDHVSKCNSDKACAGNVCSVTKSESGVLCAIRGETPAQCCVGMVSMEETGMEGASAGTGCPHAAPGAKTTTASKIKVKKS